ncbi:hypothetical protein Tco_0524888 [Tanacetum coccineum]
MTTQSFRCKTHAHIHTTVSEVIKKVFIQGFRTISENQCLLQILKVTMIGRRDIIKAFKDSNRYEHGSYNYHIALQESLMTTLITHVSSLQGQLSAALGQIQALQARGQTHVDDREGAGSSA